MNGNLEWFMGKIVAFVRDAAFHTGVVRGWTTEASGRGNLVVELSGTMAMAYVNVGDVTVQD